MRRSKYAPRPSIAERLAWFAAFALCGALLAGAVIGAVSILAV